MALWLSAKGKQHKGPQGAKRKNQKWRFIPVDSKPTKWVKGSKPC